MSTQPSQIKRRLCSLLGSPIKFFPEAKSKVQIFIHHLKPSFKKKIAGRSRLIPAWEPFSQCQSMCRSVALFARFDSASALFVKKHRRTVGYELKNGFRWHICGRKQLWPLFRKHKGVAQDHIYINGNINGRHNESTTWRDSGSQNPSLIHLRKTPSAARWGGEERSERLCFVFASSFTNSGPNRVSFL